MYDFLADAGRGGAPRRRAADRADAPARRGRRRDRRRRAARASWRPALPRRSARCTSTTASTTRSSTSASRIAPACSTTSTAGSSAQLGPLTADLYRRGGMDVKRGALVAAIMGSTVVAVDATVVNVALPTIADELGGGLAGQQWVANAYLLTLSSLILVSGSLADIYGERRVFTLGVAGFGVSSLLCALAPDRRAAGRRARAAGRLRRAAHARVAGDHRRRLPRVRARRGDRLVDGVGRHRLPRRPADRRPDRRLGLVALGVRAQRAARARSRSLLARRYVPEATRVDGERRPRLDVDRRAAVRARPRRDLVRADRAAGAAAGRTRSWRSRWSRACSCSPRSSPTSCASPAPMLPLELFARRNFTRRQRRDVPDVRRHGGAGLLPHAVPAAGRRLQRARGGLVGARADDRDVPALAPLRRARRPLRPALVHDVRAAARRRRLPADAAARRDHVVLRRPAAGAAASTRSGSP